MRHVTELHTHENFLLSTPKDPPKWFFVFTQHVKLTNFAVFDVYFITVAQNKYFLRCGHARYTPAKVNTADFLPRREKKNLIIREEKMYYNVKQSYDITKPREIRRVPECKAINNF